MVEIEFKLKNSQKREKLVLEYEEFFDPISPCETYESDGVPKFLESRDYINISNSHIEQIKVKYFGEITIKNYGSKNSLTQHTVYKDGSEMLVVQSFINNDIVHSVKLNKDQGQDWQNTDTLLISDSKGTVKSVK